MSSVTIDIHHHILIRHADIVAPIWLGLVDFFAQNLTRLGKPTTCEEVANSLYPSWLDPDGRATIRHMDDAGVATTAISVSAFSFCESNLDIAFTSRNEEVAAIVSNYPRRLIAFCGVHPRCEDPVGLLNKAIDEWGMRGVKLDPLWGDYSLDDEALYAVYERASELGIPILVHTGSRPDKPEDMRAHPSSLSPLLADFPQLKVIAAHLGFGWWRDLIKVAERSPNLYCDVSALQLSAALNYEKFCHILRRIIDGFGAHRVLFGTDGPAFDVFVSRRDWVDLIGRLPADAPSDCGFTEEETTALLDTNARQLLRLVD